MKTNNFVFGEFLLDTREKVLLRDDIPIPITPKAFVLLQTLVENHGHIVEKEQLIAAIWTDSIVEDGNLTFTVNLLRKALGDKAQNPQYIETVPRRGYRFIAPVLQNHNGDRGTRIIESGRAAMPVPPVLRKPRMWLVPILAIITVLPGSIVTGSWLWGRSSGSSVVPIVAAPLASEKLSSDGSVYHAVVSRDGKHVVYTSRSGGKQGVWLRQLDTGSNVEIIPPSDDFYGGLSLSPDGLFVYFTRKPIAANGQLDVFRVSIFGGIPTKVISETQGWIDVSHDGAKVSFVRCYYREDENCSLWLANAADGAGEMKLAARTKPNRIGENKISPDGRSVAFAVGQSENQSNDFALMSVDVDTGTETSLASETFFNIKGIAWLPNRSGLIFTAARMPSRQFRIWKVDRATRQSLPLSSDSEGYGSLSLDGAGKTLVATRVEQQFRLNLYGLETPATAPRVLADAFSIDFGRNGQIVFSSRASGNTEIWTIATDGRTRKQLTNDPAEETSPLLSPDGRSIFFTSNRSGNAQIWRMNADGSNQTKINTEEGGFPAFVSPDGSWLYYLSGLRRSLRRVTTSGDQDQAVLTRAFSSLAFAPDGTRAAFMERVGEARSLVVISIPDGQTITKYSAADGQTRLTGLGWSGDGRSLVYVLSDADHQKNSVWSLALETGDRSLLVDLGSGELAEQAGFKLSADGKLLAVGMGGWQHDAVMFTGLK